jgi:DNA modification methylase
MNGKKANLLLTDFPYNVNYEGKAGKIQNDNMSPEKFFDFLLTVFKNIETALDDEASAYVFHSDTNGEYFRRAFREAGFKLSGVCQWVKPSLVLGRSPYQWQNEPCLFGWKIKGKHKWFAGRSETTIWQFDKPTKNKLHPNCKPLELLALPIKNSSQANGIVLDLFGGSGSTMISCQMSDRICYMSELDPKYASVILRRYAENFGGENIVCERNGEILKYSDLVKAVEMK